ncbi:OmpL47-type beta-barrel domain-containing protein [Paenibacillus spongiae]|uniref:PKD domain-containing protein n=1 Tax=Paenibacillus spongiae TaxID=2909671 RepID=A0ABY5S544_9BACL|nr:PKD domain-containing protein [Paenibacillus spongiae]UVI29019.1 PKD domain-containing protein [Paenibacillus spongiae]
MVIILRKFLATILCTVLLLGASLPAAGASGLGQWISWTDQGDAYKTFGANANITIHTGKMQIIPHCPEGIADGINSWTDLYIVESGSLSILSDGKELEDVGGGGPNAVMALSSGIFISETIGYTGPDGKIPPGEYAIVFDECQDGKFNYLIDGVIDPAFKVEYTTGVVPPLDLTELKEAAEKEAKRWEKYKKYAEKLFALQKAADAGRNPNEKFVDFLMRSGLQDPRTMATLQLANQAKHYQGIADDPPDPDFKHVTPLGERPILDFQSNHPLDLAMQSLANEAANEQAITRQLWTLLERYQGAQAAGDTNWALTHAMALNDNIDLLLNQLQRTSQRVSQFNQALSADGEPLNDKAAGLEQLRTRVAASGFTADEIQYLRNLNMSDAEIDQFKSQFIAGDFAFTKQEMLAEGSGIVSDNNVLGATLVTFGSHIVDVINQLLNDPTVRNDDPVAKAGGPYTANEGTAVALNGAASTSTAGITAYEWDLNGDGVFGDAQGAAVSHTFMTSFQGYIGLKVTDAAGKQAVDYAKATIADVNRAPVITAQSPANRQVEQYIGKAETFSVSAADPDNDPISTEWFVDGVSSGSGSSFTYRPAAAGIHTIEAVVTDGSLLGGAVRVDWTAKVLRSMPAALTLSPQSKTVRVGAVHTLTAAVLDDQGLGVAGVPVTMTISGANPASYTAATDNNGVAAFSYTGTKTGDDQAIARAAGLTSPAAGVRWTTADETPPVTTAALTPAVPDGVNGNYKSPVSITFTAEDDSGIEKTEYRIDGGEWQTYQSAPIVVSVEGAHTVEYRSIDLIGNVEATKQVSFTIAQPKQPQALFYPAGPGKNVALLEERAKVEAVSSNYDSGHSAENMLKFTYHNPWATRVKDNQWVKISLADGNPYLIDRIQIRPRPSFADQRVKDFEVAVSTTTLDDAAFTTVIKSATANNGDLQEFKLPKPVWAKYILYRPLTNHGNSSVTSTQQFKVKTGLIGGQTVTFQNLSTDEDNDIVSWKWEFGDNSPISAEKEPTHTFPGPGTYPVKLTVTDSQGHTSSYTLEQTVEPADFEFMPQNPKEGETVTFVNTTAGSDDGFITSSKWLFGDSSTTTGMPVTHSYNDNKTYPVTLETVTKDGNVHRVTKDITTTNVPPAVRVGDGATLLGGQNYRTGIQISDPGGADKHTCHWDFGDGTTSSLCTFDHAYPVMEKDAPDKQYEAVVTVRDDDGGEAKASMTFITRAEQTPRQIAFYTFDDTFDDFSGNGNHGKPAVGNPTFAEGIVGKAAKFDGRSGVTVEDSDSLDLSTNFSFSMWLYKEDAGSGGYAPILTKGNTSDYGPYSFLHDPSGKSPGVRLVSGDRPGYTHLFPDTPVGFKEWYLSTVTWDGKIIKYYINGELRATREWAGVFKNTTEKVTIGFDPPGATEYFRGLMDDFRIFNYPLTEKEIDELYDRKNPDVVPPVTTAVSTSASGPDPVSGWHRSDITITLTATDDSSGVKLTEYRMNGSEWKAYTAPVVLPQDGVYTFEYRSTDQAGNVENPQSMELKLDKSAPITRYHFDPIMAVNKAGRPYISGFTVTLRAEEPVSGSGIRGTLYRINGGAWMPYTGSFTAMAGTTHIVEYYSTDQAGNPEVVMNKMDFAKGIFTGAGSF